MKMFAFEGRTGMLTTYTTLINNKDLASVFGSFFKKAEAAIDNGADIFELSQRVLNMTHVRAIKTYLNRQIRVVASPVAACNVNVIRRIDSGNLVEIEMRDPHLVDGQKRVKANILMTEEFPDYNNDIPLLIVNTSDPFVIQQMFSDINSTPAKVSPALTLVYDHSNPLSSFIPKIVPHHLLEMEKGTVSKSSNKLVTTTIMKEAIASLFGTSTATLSTLPVESMLNNWDQWHPYMSKLFAVYEALASKTDAGLPALRESSILPHNVTFLACVRLIPLAKSEGVGPDFMDKLLDLHAEGLTDRTNACWNDRCISFGAMKKSAINIERTAAMLGVLLEIPLNGALAMLAPKPLDTKTGRDSTTDTIEQLGLLQSL